jgi:hypothetical protein
MLPVSETFGLSGDAKICSDLDIVSFYMSGRTPVNIHSFGSLYLFNKAKKPKEAGSATRCLECPYESQCVWSAKKIYLESDMDHVSRAEGHSAKAHQVVDDEDRRRRRGLRYRDCGRCSENLTTWCMRLRSWQ